MFQARGIDQVAQPPVYEVNNDNNNVDDDAGDKGFVDYDNDDSGGDGFMKMIMIMIYWIMLI